MLATTSTCLTNGPANILENASVLVIGASGFIGRRLVADLIRKGADVHATSRRSRESTDLLCWHRLDPQNEHDVRALFRSIRPQFVFHLSSLATASREMSLVVPTMQAELCAAVNVLLAATESGCRSIVLPASLEEPASGAAPACPYAAAKAATASYASMFYALYRTPVRLARVYMAYGPGQSATKVVPQLIRSLLLRGGVTVTSPTRRVDWIYIDDVVEGLVAVAATDGLDGQRFELGSGHLVSIGDVAKCLSRISLCKEMSLVVSEQPPLDEVIRCADLAATTRSTGWQPRVGLEEGLRRTVDAIRQELAS